MPTNGAIKNGHLGCGSWFGLSATNTVLGVNPDGRKIAHAAKKHDGKKAGGDWFGTYAEQKQAGTISPGRLHGKGSAKRAQASAEIAKIPFPLAQHIARVFKP
jgi:hypothetical protein